MFEKETKGTFSISFQPGIFTLLSYELLSLVDRGESMSVKSVLNMCEDYTIMPWLRDNVKTYQLWDNEIKIILAEEFASLANVISPEGKYGIANNGILVLIAFCQELINEKTSRTIEDCDDAKDVLIQMNLI